MALDYNDLQFLKYLQENNNCDLAETAAHFYRNTSSIRRQLTSVCRHLGRRYPLEIHNSQIRTGLTYSDYLAIIRDLTMDDYITSCKERLQYLIVRSFYESTINLSRLYEQLGLSPTTKKSDTTRLRALLSAYGLELEIVKKKGVRIVGDEMHFRMLLVGILLPLLEWDAHDGLKHRQANTPIQRLMADLCIAGCHPNHSLLLEDKLKTYHLSYQSRKLLILYLNLLANRQEHNTIITMVHTKLPVINWQLLNHPLENEALLHIIAMLDFEAGPLVPVDIPLSVKIDNLLNAIAAHYQITFYRQQQIHHELYHYFYKIYFQNFYHIQIKDKMVRDTDKQFPDLYSMIRRLSDEIGTFIDIPLYTENYTTLTLIFKKWITFHQLSGENVRKIVLVTNTSSERSRFFISALEDLVEFELVAIISIQEILQLKMMQYHHIITLSERTSVLLNEQGLECLRLEFFLTTKDLLHLLKAGFSPARKRLSAAMLAKQTAGRSEKAIQELLLQHYSTYVI